MVAIYEAYKGGFLKIHFWGRNIVAGLVVAIVALPLAMAFAIASGAKPEQGIYTAIIAGLIIALFGGTRTQISGPTGAFVVILAGITAEFGFVGLQIATILAGGILLLMSLLRAGVLIRFIPYPVIIGFTSGIGVIIFVGQWKDFFGLSVSIPIDATFSDKVMHLIEYLPTFHLATTFLASLSLLLLVMVPKYLKTIPAPLIVMLLVSFLQYFFKFEGVATIGSVFGEIPQSLPYFSVPDVMQIQFSALILPAFTIAFLGAIESLLSAAAADSISGTKHHANQELFGQGLANVVVPFFGGFASTGAIARTVTNIRNGGNSPLAGIVHSGALVCVLVLFAPYAAHIPFAVLAAILFMVAYNMSDIPEFLYLLKKAPWYDVLSLVLTFLMTIFTDLIIAVFVGMVVSVLFFLFRTHQTTRISFNFFKRLLKREAMSKMSTSFAKDGIVYTIEGAFYFGVAERMEQALAVTHTDPKYVVFRLAHVPFIDMTGLATLSKMIEQYRNRSVKVYLCEANARVSHKIRKVGLLGKVQDQLIFRSLTEIEQILLR